MSSPPEILSVQKIFHRWQPCPFEYFLVCHFVHRGYPYDRTQVSHHEGMLLFHLSSVHSPGLGSIEEGGQHDCMVYLAFNPPGHLVVVSESLALLAQICTSHGHSPLYLIVNAYFISYSASEVGEFQNIVQLVSINHVILLSGSCRVE